MLWAVMEADAVTVSTPALADVLRAYHPSVYVLPNTLDDALWPMSGRNVGSEAGGPVVIGYMGSGTHADDLNMIGPALAQVADRFGAGVVFRFIGGSLPPDAIAGRPNVVWERVKFLDYAEFAGWFAHQGLDIGLAPLLDTPFNRCKSNIKYLEYSASGMAGVYSRVTPYSTTIGDGEGVLAGPSDEWAAALARLVEDAALRRTMGEVAQRSVQTSWRLSAHAGEWEDAYRVVIERGAGHHYERSGAILQALAAWRVADDARAARELAEVERVADGLRGQVADLGRVADRLREQVSDLERRSQQLAMEAEGYRVQIRELDGRTVRQDEAILWLEHELQLMRRSITWRGTEPVRQAYSRVQKLQDALRKARTPAPEPLAELPAPADEFGAAPEMAAEARTPDAPVEAPVASFSPEYFFWTEQRFEVVPALPTSPETDIIICIGKNTDMAERCVVSVRRNTPPGAYRLRLVVHADDAAGLSQQMTADADVIVHRMKHFNFSRANNLALARCAGDVVLLNDDTEVTQGWLEQLREDSRGFALTGVHTGFQCSGNPDMWGSGARRITWHPINMFCAFIPQRVRQVVGLLDEEYSYYGGEDVDYSCKALQHGFPLVVSSAFVNHASAKSFGAQKQLLMQESDKILRERYSVNPPYDLRRIKPLASVIMATRNRATMLPAAAESILGGLYPELELIVVDDASEDETPAAMSALQRSDLRVIGIRLPAKEGAVRARQRGLTASRGQFVAFMDDDDTAWPNRVMAPLQHLMTHPELDVVYCAFDVVTELGRQRGRTQPFDEADYLAMKFDIGSGILLVRRQVMLDVPFMTYYERAIDFDWVFRLLRYGYRIDYCPAVVLDYNRHGPSEAHLSGNEAAMRVHHAIRDRERLMQQYGRK
jgi:GT2 family glycosyltransferase